MVPVSSLSLLPLPLEAAPNSLLVMPRTEEELQVFFKFSVDREALAQRLAGVKRAKEYVRMTLECVNKLRSSVRNMQSQSMITHCSHRCPLEEE